MHAQGSKCAQTESPQSTRERATCESKNARHDPRPYQSPPWSHPSYARAQGVASLAGAQHAGSVRLFLRSSWFALRTVRRANLIRVWEVLKKFHQMSAGLHTSPTRGSRRAEPPAIQLADEPSTSTAPDDGTPPRTVTIRRSAWRASTPALLLCLGASVVSSLLLAASILALLLLSSSPAPSRQRPGLVGRRELRYRNKHVHEVCLEAPKVHLRHLTLAYAKPLTPA